MTFILLNRETNYFHTFHINDNEMTSHVLINLGILFYFILSNSIRIACL